MAIVPQAKQNRYRRAQMQKERANRIKGILDEECLQADLMTGKCAAYDKPKCDNCKAKISDPDIYVGMLVDMFNYTKGTNKRNEIGKEINYIIDLFKLDRPKVGKEAKQHQDWLKCYYEDQRRGSGGGKSENNVNTAGIKQRMKDNRIQETKLTRPEKDEIYEITQEWEAENGKLPKLSRSPLSRNKIDSYTGEPIVEPKKGKKK